MSDDLHPVWVDTSDCLARVVDRCASADRFALDTEADSMHSYFHKVCLIQVSVAGRHFIVDPLALDPDHLQPLWHVVEKPTTTVLMHGADYDLRVLDRDYGARVHGLLDTQVMAQLLGEEKTGLAALLAKELGVELDKKYQRADWGRRPLPAAQLAYAAADTAHLGPLSDRLRRRLEAVNRWAWAVEDSVALESVRHAANEPDPYAFERIKGARALRGVQRDRLFTLFQWREEVAQALDVPPFKVIGNKPLLHLATEPPVDVAALRAVDGIGPRALRRWGRDLMRRLHRPDDAPERRPARRPTVLDNATRQRVKRLAEVRDEVAGELGLSGGLLCPRACIEQLATHSGGRARVRDLERSGLSGWRLEVLGERFAAVLA
jgi:ribonuclease D